jgi:hypothetical protein
MRPELAAGVFEDAVRVGAVMGCLQLYRVRKLGRAARICGTGEALLYRRTGGSWRLVAREGDSIGDFGDLNDFGDVVNAHDVSAAEDCGGNCGSGPEDTVLGARREIAR